MVAVIGIICRRCNSIVAFDDEDILKQEAVIGGYLDCCLAEESYVVCPTCTNTVHIRYENHRPFPSFQAAATSPLPDPISVPSKEELKVPTK